MNGKPVVVVLFGGRSTEHAISCVSAGCVLGAIDRDAFDVVPVGITRDGAWVRVGDDPSSLSVIDGTLPTFDGGEPVALSADPTAPGSLGRVDVVFPLLHGPYGEDGTVQGLLELAGTPYVGSGVLASAVAMDKHHMKNALAAAGLPGVAHVVVTASSWTRDPGAVRDAVARLGWPVYVKPARGGSSIGISRVTDVAGVDAAISLAQQADPKVIIEAAAVGREIECGVLQGVGRGVPEASLPAEVRVVGRDFYDFEAKYADGATEFDVPAKLPDDVTDHVRALAVDAFTSLDCEGLARVDFFVGDGGDVVVNEVNTMPGFTPSSMFPRMWAATGIPYAALVDRLLRTALDRRPGLR